MAVIGYARVSTQDQDFAGQIEKLKAAGAERIYSEKISGARAPEGRKRNARDLGRLRIRAHAVERCRRRGGVHSPSFKRGSAPALVLIG